jgi:hypothetical protein
MATNRINFFRGDTATYLLSFKDESGDAYSLTGLTLTITCNSLRNPTAAEITAGTAIEYWSVTMSIVSASAGTATFALSATEADMAPATYYVDVESVDAGGLKKTFRKYPFIVTQDINK